MIHFFVGVLVLLWLAPFVSPKLAHRFWGWHVPGDSLGFDGATVTTRCSMCDKRIGQDSQGNWFAFARQDGGEHGE